MGNKNTKPIASFSDWQKVQSEGDIEIYKNKKNNELAEKRSITIDPHFEIEDQLKIYHMRQNNNDSLVRAYGVQEAHKKGHSQGICSGRKKLQVLTEKMPYRLTDLPQLTFPQALLFLRESLRAYFRVFKSYGPIHVTKRLIGVNEFGEVKSWVNENWALNHPNNDLPTLQSTKLQSFSARSTQVGAGSEAYDARYRDETEMVHNIVAVIEEKCEEGKFPKAFSEEVEQHSGSFRKLSTYVQDFIRVNELFIPPKINYETVFVSKYQTRLAEQHQMSEQQSIANQLNQGQSNGQSTTVQNQKIATNTSIGGQSLGYTTAGGYQQSLSGQQSFGYGTNISQSPLINQEGYTVTKNTTTSYGNTMGSKNNNVQSTYIPSYQTSAYQTSTYEPYQANSSILTTNNNISNTPNTIPWQKTQSLYKLPQNQSSYTTSYQYSATNPSSVGNYSYNFGGKSINNGVQLGNEPYKPSSYSSAFSNGPVGGTSYSNYSGLGNNGNSNTFTSLENKFGGAQNNRFAISSDTENPSSPYQHLAQFSNNERNNQFQTYSTQTPNKASYEQFKKNFTQGTTGTGLNTYEYSTTNYQGGNNNLVNEPILSDSAEKGSNFSFDGKNNFAAKFTQYSGKGYSNKLNSYSATTSVNPDGALTDRKYTFELNSLLGPFIKMKQEYETHQKSPNYSLSNNQGFLSSQENPPLQHA